MALIKTLIFVIRVFFTVPLERSKFFLVHYLLIKSENIDIDNSILVVSDDRMDTSAGVSPPTLASGWHIHSRYRSLYNNSVSV